ncbi:molybdopterin-dependent oxidoreductase [Nocardia vinacea]|uniref:Molybdopterin-dependent oxidoreductase n=1 Tax=Nocardia vinacea TaxID=96468 RepID=A0ABZ1YNJ6_9NOCA|nr:molybdopterin-dependent oxidoreductase [Nocardia vinacea]
MAREQVTFCRICEPFCGLIATVEGDRLTSLRPDPDHPTSQGFACPKGVAYVDIQNDPDRVTHPLKRLADGSFEEVSWEKALADIAARLRRIRAEYGGGAIAMYMGNPAALNYSATVWSGIFTKGLGIHHLFTSGSQDTNSRFAASALLYGMPLLVPIPDFDSSELVVILGANPVVSHGSLVTAGRIKDRLHSVTARGGRVLVIDPRRTETAEAFEWLPIVPDSDAWLLLSLLHTMISGQLVDEAAVRAVSSGWSEFAPLLEDFTPQSAFAHTGILPEQVAELARQLVAHKAVVYGRTGTCLGQHATLVNFLIDVVNLVAGNLDTRGGSVFADPVTPLLDRLAERGGAFTYGARRTRVGGFKDVFGTEPAANMAAEMTTPGQDQVRALFVTAGNPVLSVPNGPKLEQALSGLDLVVAIDLYVNETGKYADYVLPATAMYEREDIPLFASALYSQPFIQVTEAVVTPLGQARPEWEIFEEIVRRTKQTPLRARLSKALRRIGIRPTPQMMRAALVRLGRGGDRFGLRPGGLTVARLLADHPHGVLFAREQPIGRLRKVIRHDDGLLHLDHDDIRSEVERLKSRTPDPAYPLRLIGIREVRSENSWMHNVRALRSARPAHAARMHPDDAERLGLRHNDQVRLVSKTGRIELPLMLTTDVKDGVVAVPHGWGHNGGTWRRANREGGTNYNALASSDPRDIEQLSGSAHLSGIPVRAERIED